MMKDKRTVSAVIPAYNREKTIRRCIDSVLRQTYEVSEIIVVDDGSTDGTLEILANEYKEKVKVIKQPHRGAQAARNAGIRAAEGEYIAFLDSDDEWTERRIELQMQVLAEKPDAVVCGNGYVVQGGRKKIWRMSGHSGYVYKMILVSSFVLFPTIITKKENLLKIGLLDENVPSYQEWDTAIMLSKICEFVFLDRPLFIYYLHDGETISKNKKKDIDGREYLCQKYRYEILEQYGLPGLTRRYEVIRDRCKTFRDKRYFKYLFLYALSKRGIILDNEGMRAK